MKKLTRAMLLAVCSVAIAMPTRAAEVDPLLPSDTEQVIHVNMKQILESDIIKKNAIELIKQQLEAGEAQKVLKELGLDPLKDIDTITMGLWGKDPQNMSVVGVVRGRFDSEKMFAAAEKAAKDAADKVSIVEEGEFKLVKFVGNNDKPGFVSMADGKTMIIGSDAKLVVASLKSAAKKEKAQLSKALSALVLKQDAKASMFFCGIMEDKIPKEFNVPAIPGVDADKLKDGLTKVTNAAITIRLGKDLNLDVVLGMKDADAADDFGATLGKLVDTAKTFLPLLGMNAPNMKALIDDVSGSLKSTSKEKDIILSVKLSSEALAAAAKGGNNQ